MKSITRFTKNIHGDKCLNCENPLSEEDNFCPQCGQVNDIKKISLKQYFSVYFDDFFSFDNRLFNTILPLIFKPGSVTKNYVAGKRMSYMNPFQLYLHITILFFLVISVFKTLDQFKPGGEKSSVSINEMNRDNALQALDTIKSATLKEIENSNIGLDSAARADLRRGIDKIGPVPVTDTLVNDTLKNHEKVMIHYVDSLFSDPNSLLVFENKNSTMAQKDSVMESVLISIHKKAQGIPLPDNAIMVEDWGDLGEGWAEISKKRMIKETAVSRIKEIFISKNIDYVIPQSLISRSEKEKPENDVDGMFKKIMIFMDYEKKADTDVLQALDDLGYEKSYWNIFLYTKSKDWNEAVKDPESYGSELRDRILSRISVALFFLLPFFTLFVSLLYIRSKFNYTEHLVFVFHTQTVFFILLLLFIILGRSVNSDSVPWIFLPLFLIYLYMAMKNFYGQGWFKTIIKYLFLNFSFMILAAIGGVIISFLAFMI